MLFFRKTSLIFLFVVGGSILINAQELNDFENLFAPIEHQHQYLGGKELKESKNGAQFTLSLLFVFYKKFLSSQDVSRCSFTPSCSVYSVQSIRRSGVIVGLLATFDRLSRCNSYPKKGYEHDDKKNKWIDK